MATENKKADEIVEETMKEIYDDIASNDFDIDDDYIDIEDEDTLFDDVTDFLDNSDSEDDYIEHDKDSADDDKEDLFAIESDTEFLNHEEIKRRMKDNSSTKKKPQEPKPKKKQTVSEEPKTNKSDKIQNKKASVKAHAKKKGKNKKKSGAGKIIGITFGAIAGICILVYAGFSIYFGSHYLFNTTINGVDFSMKSAEEAQDYMASQVGSYSLTLNEIDGQTEEINGSDIGIEYTTGDKLQDIIEEQNNWLWFESLYDYPELEAEIGVSYDKDLLQNTISSLGCMNPEEKIEPKNAKPKYSEKKGKYVVKSEVLGNELEEDKLEAAVETAVSGLASSIDLEEEDCYVLPKYTSKSKKVKNAVKKLNKYLKAEITLDFDPDTEVVDSSVIKDWLSCDSKYNVSFDEDQVYNYVQDLAYKYNTVGNERTFTTATGDTATVSGGSYGWAIDKDTESQQLIDNIKNGDVVTREVAYYTTAANHTEQDFGDTFCEVDITNQIMYYVENGEVKLKTDVVTGAPSNGHDTTLGVYYIDYKQAPSTLKGYKANGKLDYSTKVAYWMNFNNGIGFHDATWQSAFGGTRYKDGYGSHGCVNMPLDKAGELYDLVSVGCPVVVHE